jgi:hypothetical protein
MAMVPHERSLVKRLENKPFALLGINFDKTPADLKRVEKKAEITWRSWFDGEDGPIGKAWHIRYLPTVYVLDAKGVIRFKDLRGEELDKAVDKLLKEMESGGKP